MRSCKRALNRHNKMNWIFFALLTVITWGVYGVLLHTGQTQMVPGGGMIDSEARYKSFLFVGLAYFLVAVLAPLILLMLQGKAQSAISGGRRQLLVPA